MKLRSKNHIAKPTIADVVLSARSPKRCISLWVVSEESAFSTDLEVIHRAPYERLSSRPQRSEVEGSAVASKSLFNSAAIRDE